MPFIERPGTRPYAVLVSRLTELAPGFVRVTVTGDELHHFAAHRQDQRFKVVFPRHDGGFADIGQHAPDALAAGEWYHRWRALPDEERNPLRTYTVRDARPEAREVDIDFVRHADTGDLGPAGRWLRSAAVGDPLLLVGPDGRSADSRGGIAWSPGAAATVLLVGDETAAPAVANIMETQPGGVCSAALVEVGHPLDGHAYPAADGVTWVLRGHARGAALFTAVETWVAHHHDDVGPDLYVWLAGESGLITRLRRFMVGRVGLDKTAVDFMGYWKAGQAESL